MKGIRRKRENVHKGNMLKIFSFNAAMESFNDHRALFFLKKKKNDFGTDLRNQVLSI